MKSIIFTLALFSCGEAEQVKESVDKTVYVGNNEKESNNTEKIEAGNNQKIEKTAQLICENENNTAIYDRDSWGNWSTKGDLQNVRHQVLLEESLESGECEGESLVIQDEKVLFGCWVDVYSNEIYKDSSDLDIDHLVPLKEAFISGAYNWTKEKKKEYYNYMIDKNHLIAVSSTLNRSKGSKDVKEWLPITNIERYIKNWIDVKFRWNLSIDPKELEILKEYSNDPRLPNNCN